MVNSTNKFYDLPEELLTAVAEEVITEDRQCVSNLKALRLSSPRFAYLEVIQKNLFGGIRLLATSEHLEHLAQADICRIAPFVKSITLAAPFNSWTLPFEGRESIATRTRATREGQGECSWPAPDSFRKPIYMQWDNHHYYIEREYDDEFTLSDDEIRVTFEQYHHDALATQHFLLGKNLREVWIRSLRLLQDVHEFRFTIAKFNELGIMSLPLQRGWKVLDGDNVTHHSKELCRKAAGAVGDALFATGIKCLAEAHIEVRNLDVGCEMTNRFEWEALPGWLELDLSQMSMFVFNPNTGCDSRVRMIPNTLDNLEDLDSPEDHAGAKLAADAVSAALKKCKDNLKSLNYGDACPMSWPPDEVIHLPKLTNLSLEGGEVRPRNLGSWIRKMPSLDYFELYGCWIDLDLPTRDWLYIFDAIRDHPRGIEIDLDLEHTKERISLEYRTDRIEDWLALSEKERLYCNPDWPLYLSGKIEVTDFMESWFDYDPITDFDERNR